MSARLWSQKGTRKIIDMKTEIDDLLEVVSPVLVGNYERLNLPAGASSLMEVNEEYKGANKDLSSIITKGQLLLLKVVVVGYILAAILSMFGIPVLTSFIPLVGSASAVAFWIDRVLSKKVQKAKEVLSRCRPILQDFREALDALGSPVGATNREYTEASVHSNFVTHAVTILDGEIKLDKIRLGAERRTSDLIHLANWIEKRQAKFRKASEGLKKFGLKFDKRELFAEAKKRLERSYA